MVMKVNMKTTTVTEAGEKEKNDRTCTIQDFSNVIMSPSPHSNGVRTVELTEQRSSSPSAKELAAAISVSEMQASFAERTATEMEEIVNWYNKFEGDDRFKNGNQQRQSMPDNAMIADEEEDYDHPDEHTSEDCDDLTSVKATLSEDIREQHQPCTIGDEETVVVKDYYTPNQKAKVSNHGMSSTRSVSSKSSRNMFSSILRTLSKSRHGDEGDDDCHEPPPRAIKIRDAEDDDVSVLSSLLHTPKVSRKSTTPTATARSPIMDAIADAIAASGHSHLLYENQDQIIDDIVITKSSSSSIVGYFDEEKKVLAMLSPKPCNKVLSIPRLSGPEPEGTDGYVDQEAEVLAMLSPGVNKTTASKTRSICSSAQPPVEASVGEMYEPSKSLRSSQSIEKEAHCQIEATDQLIRNTQHMADIISQLKLPSLSPSCSHKSNESDDDYVQDNALHDNFETNVRDDDSIDENDVSLSTMHDSYHEVIKAKGGLVLSANNGFHSDASIQLQGDIHSTYKTKRRRRGKRDKENRYNLMA